MPRFRIKDLTVDLPLAGGEGGESGGCGSVTNPCLMCTQSPTVAGAEHAGHAVQGCITFTRFCTGCTLLATHVEQATLCGGCSQVTNPCLGCTQNATLCGGCSHVTNPCLGCTQNATLCGGCSFITNPCLGCTQVASLCGGCSHLTNPCIGCTGSPTFVDPAGGGTACQGGATRQPGLGPDPAQLAALKEQLRGQLRQIEQHEAAGGLPNDPGQVAELEERLQSALDEVRQHRARLEEQGGEPTRDDPKQAF